MGAILCVLLLLLPALCFVVFETLLEDPHYSVTIDSVSGLDPVLGSRPALDRTFNLTFRVASHGFLLHECTSHGLQVDVSYRGNPLASSMTIAEQICARPRKTVDHAIVARGDAVVLPGSVLNNLVGDMHNGVQVFNVALRGWGKDANYMCGPRWVGDGYALRKECEEISTDV
jgi:hypothetical protein